MPREPGARETMELERKGEEKGKGGGGEREVMIFKNGRMKGKELGGDGWGSPKPF